MDPQQPTAAPDRFVRQLQKAMKEKRLSLRQFAEQAAVSPSFLSRIFNRERGLPSDETIAKFEEVLDVEPRGLLFDAAGRHDHQAAKFFKRNEARLFLRTVAPLSDAEFSQVQKLAQGLAAKHLKNPK